MPSFFEKLKKGMGISELETEIEEEPKKARAAKKLSIISEDKPKRTRRKSLVNNQSIKKISLPERELKSLEIKQGESEEEKMEKEDVKEGPKEIKTEPAKKKEAEVEINIKTAPESRTKERWSGLGGEQEGQLAVDVYQTETHLVIQAAIAGVGPESLDISMEKDVITIKGWRDKQFDEGGDYFTQECYWGPFSREVILPVEIDPDEAEATMKQCILTIKMPKILREKKRKISIRNI
jgi:HSP20 family protein